MSKKNIFVTFPRAYSDIGEKGKIGDTLAIPQLIRFRSHGGVVSDAIYMRITFFYTRYLLASNAGVPYETHRRSRAPKVSTCAASSFLNRVCGFLSLRLHVFEIRS